LRGFGFLVPQSERLVMLGTVFNSLLFSGRAPEDRLLFTSFLGGVSRPEVFDWPDERIFDSVCSELKRVLKASIQPEPLAIFRHRRAIPQYNVGHRQRVETVAAQLSRIPGLFITGNFLHGVSVPACMEHGDNTATAVSEFLQTDTNALPFLDAALRAHLRRFPATANGLGETKNRALELIAGGSRDFSGLFDRFSKSESIYGYGDAQFWLDLRQLCDGPAPLAIVEDFEIELLQHQLLTPQLVKTAKFQITAAGEAVLANEADFITLNGIDEWLGGVHLHDPENLWRWDEAAQRLRFSSGPAVSEFGY